MKWTLTGSGVVLGAVLTLSTADAAQAQSQGYGGTGQLQAGYGGSRYTTARPVSGSTRDANHNRLIVNGIIQTGVGAYSSSSGGASATGSWGLGGDGRTTIGGSTAIGNQLNVVVQGNNNTVIVNSTQTNTGNVRAGTSLNGTLDLP
ncbi:MAG: holdfast anchoring protein HfaA [Caulobacteraceae bacterium]|nr:holdfast anchoring protein HfaA [Caulobacteraceae bacterium]